MLHNNHTLLTVLLFPVAMNIPRVVPPLPATFDEVIQHLTTKYPWLSTEEGF